MGELDMYRQAGTTPNFSEIARRHGIDRRTVAKYWKAGVESVEDMRRERPSGYDRFRDVIEEKAALPGVTKKGIHEYLLHRYPAEQVPGYNALTHYMRRHGIVCGRPSAAEPHPRFETRPGEQMQFDWKEDIRMVSRHGELFVFNVLAATLGHSRLHRFRYSRTRTSDDLCAGLLDIFVSNGGMTEKAVTDNMSAVVIVEGGRRRKVERTWRFAKEAGFTLELCASGTPQTKGKVESSNRFLTRLRAYDHDFEDEAELIEIIARIEQRCNSEPNEETGAAPCALFLEEKEFLRPVGNVKMLEEMIGGVSVQTVPQTMLVRALGREWSVPMRCIGRKVKVLATDGGSVRVYMGSELVALHDAGAPGGKVVYEHSHYVEALAGKSRFADADIERAARENLELLSHLGERK